MKNLLDPLLGLLLVGCRRPEGLARFGHTKQAFLASLAPLLGFPIAIAMVVLMKFGTMSALAVLAPALVIQLAPPVLSHLLAVRWGREPLWLHYASAYNWCRWTVAGAMLVLLVVLGVALNAGVPVAAARHAFTAALALYSLWLDWFLARHGLQLSGGKAALLVLFINVGTGVLVLLPVLIAG